MHRTLLTALALAVAATATWAPSGEAATPAAGTLADAHGQVRWEGVAGPGAAPLPEACAVSKCDQFELTVRLPASARSDPGGVQVGVRWGEEGQDVDLYVFGPDDPDRLAASSTGTNGFSAAQSVLLRDAADGEYRVVVVPVSVSHEDGVPYTGIAEVERDPDVEPVRDLLPNLVPFAPRNLRLEIGAYFSAAGLGGDGPSCYPEEMAEQGARRCLRFDQGPSNLGDGAFELRYVTSDVDGRRLQQRIFRSDGSFRDRDAARWEFHPTHGHFHFEGFMGSRLWRADADGARVDDEPVREGRKTGFCMIDVDNVMFGEKGDAAKTYGFPRCQAPTDDTTGAHMTNGVSRGWADVYNWFLPDQYIEISGVPDGLYLLESLADPDCAVLETTDADNSASVLLQLTGDQVEVLGPPRSERRTTC